MDDVVETAATTDTIWTPGLANMQFHVPPTSVPVPAPAISKHFTAPRYIDVVPGSGNGLQELCVGLKRTMSDILCEIKKVLDIQRCAYHQAPDNRLLLENTDVQIELQLQAGRAENRLKFRRISGDSSSYNQLCSDLLAGMNL